MTPLPFTRANVLAVWAPRLIGWAIGSAFAVICFVGLAQRWGWW